MRAGAWAIAIAAAAAAGACGTPSPGPARVAPPVIDAGVDAAAAAPKDALPAAVERLVQLLEEVAALPKAGSCDEAKAAIAAVRVRYAYELAMVDRARVTRPSDVEALWVEHAPRVAAAWPRLQRPICMGAELDLLGAP